MKALLESYDIIIVGAGPGGLQCAATLGPSGMSVLLVEKKSEIGPKVCAGGLTALNDDFSLPPELTLSFNKQYVFLNNRERVVTLAKPVRTIDRRDLGRFQLKRLQAYQNVHVLTGTRVETIGKAGLELDGGRRLKFKYLVGADGSLSLVRRFLKLENKLYYGIQYILPEKHERMVWFFEPALIGSGYAWIIPHETFSSAGVFFNPRLVSAKKAIEALGIFLDRSGIAYRGAKQEAAPVNCLYRGVEFGNIFLIGDAAGLASAATGEGIAYALTSGEEAACRIMDRSYQMKHLETILGQKQGQEKILALLDRLPALQSPLFRLFFMLAKYRTIQKHLTG